MHHNSSLLVEAMWLVVMHYDAFWKFPTLFFWFMPKVGATQTTVHALMTLFLCM